MASASGFVSPGVNGVPHHNGRLRGVQNDDGFPRARAPDFLQTFCRRAGELVDVLPRPGPALLLAMVATISAYSTGVTERMAATIGMVACPPHVVKLMLGASKWLSKLTTGTTAGPSFAGVRSMSLMPRSSKRGAWRRWAGSGRRVEGEYHFRPVLKQIVDAPGRRPQPFAFRPRRGLRNSGRCPPSLRGPARRCAAIYTLSPFRCSRNR